MCCDSCPRAYHRACCDLPLHGRLPAVWHCPWCRNCAVDLTALERFMAVRPGPRVRIMPGADALTTVQCGRFALLSCSGASRAGAPLHECDRARRQRRPARTLS